jgi:putative ABC transport system permease protein
VLCNACFLIANRARQIQVHSGVDEHALAAIRLTGFDEQRGVDLNARVLSGLARVPGVQSVTVMSAVPFGGSPNNAGIMKDADGKHFGGVVNFYLGGPGSFKALGLQLVAGPAPKQGDFQPIVHFVPDDDALVWITRSLAEHVWPGANPLGQEFWVGRSHFRVGGVIAHLARPSPGEGGPSTIEWSVFVPSQPGPRFAGDYLLRATPGQLPRVLRDVRKAITTIAPDAVLDSSASQGIASLRESFFRQDRVMVGILVGVIAAMLLVTALGIVGLASFWVQQRRRQIGIRRAIGASRRDILQYFQTENFLIVTFGIVLGMLLAFALNITLMKFYELPRLPLYYLPIGALVLWALGQLAVLGPALRAAAVPPVVATRSV